MYGMTCVLNELDIRAKSVRRRCVHTLYFRHTSNNILSFHLLYYCDLIKYLSVLLMGFVCYILGCVLILIQRDTFDIQTIHNDNASNIQILFITTILTWLNGQNILILFLSKSNAQLHQKTALSSVDSCVLLESLLDSLCCVLLKNIIFYPHKQKITPLLTTICRSQLLGLLESQIVLYNHNYCTYNVALVIPFWMHRCCLTNACKCCMRRYVALVKVIKYCPCVYNKYKCVSASFCNGKLERFFKWVKVKKQTNKTFMVHCVALLHVLSIYYSWKCLRKWPIII